MMWQFILGAGSDVTGLNWVEDALIWRYVVCWDSSSVLVSTGKMSSDSRQDIVFDILHLLYRIKHRGIEVDFLWLPVNIGVDAMNRTISLKRCSKKKSCRFDYKIQ